MFNSPQFLYDKWSALYRSVPPAEDSVEDLSKVTVLWAYV